jgi:hypothetical protein
MIGKTVLVPLTNSLYVPGKIRDSENVLIDVGTGYFVKKVSLRALLCFLPFSVNTTRIHHHIHDPPSESSSYLDLLLPFSLLP